MSRNTPDPISTVLEEAEQSPLAPGAVRVLLAEGNARFAGGNLTRRDHGAQLPHALKGQSPMAIVLGCVDSRVPVEMVFDCGIGDLFVARVAGNIVNADMLGSMEYACRVAGSKLIVVLGHQHCGAVKSAVDEVEFGNVTELLAKIAPAVNASETDGERSSDNADFVANVAAANVRHAVERIRNESPILAAMEAGGEIGIVGAVYSLDTGLVAFVDEIA